MSGNSLLTCCCDPSLNDQGKAGRSVVGGGVVLWTQAQES